MAGGIFKCPSCQCEQHYSYSAFRNGNVTCVDCGTVIDKEAHLVRETPTDMSGPKNERTGVF